MADDVTLYAAGSLRAALSHVVRGFERDSGRSVATIFGPSGLLRRRIEAGEPAHVFASADMANPQALAEAGRAGPVTVFARNELCALAAPHVVVGSDSLLSVLLDPDVRVGTSTPGSDPAGDYAWALFANAEVSRPGACEMLRAKAQQLTGGPHSDKPPASRDPYAWVMESGRADVFLTYRTNALLAKQEAPTLQIVAVPESLAVAAECCVTVMDGAPADASDLAAYILSSHG